MPFVESNSGTMQKLTIWIELKNLTTSDNISI